MANNFIAALAQSDLLLNLSWDQWLDIKAPFPTVKYNEREVTTRFERNGYVWDIHGRLYEPQSEAKPGIGFVMLHGGAGSEMEMHETPDGRPGVAAVVASQGFRCLSITYPGHYPPTKNGAWKGAVSRRQPVYLLDQTLSVEETAARNIRCTYNTICQGAGQLVDHHMSKYKIWAFGHSTGGPMSISLHRFVARATIIGILGWGSGGPDGWLLEWFEWTKARTGEKYPLDLLARRTTESFRRAGYEDDASLTPWGTADDYTIWADLYKSQMKTGLCDNQHGAGIEYLKNYAKLTGLPIEEYIDHLRDPDPTWLASVKVLLLVGENDPLHWKLGGNTLEHKQELFMAKKFAPRAQLTRLVRVPRYGHFGFAGKYNEKIVYAWLQFLDYT